MKDSEEILTTYIQKVLKLQQEHQHSPLSVTELEKVAQDLGLTEQDIQFIDQKFQDYLYRGTGYLRYKNWDKAIEEFQQAVVLKPLHIEALYGLADAFRQRWVLKGRNTDKKKALSYAERCLQSEARHEGALHLVSQLHQKKKHIAQKDAFFRLFLILFSVVTIVFLGYLVLQEFALFSSDTPPTPVTLSKNQEEEKEIVVKEKKLQIPLQLTKNTSSTGLLLDIENSFLQENDNGETMYHLRACLLNERYEIPFLQLKLQLLDGQHQVRHEEMIDLVHDETPEMWPSDAFPMSKIIRTKGAIQQARLLVADIEKLFPEEEVISRTLPLEWEEGVTPFKLEVRERYQVIYPRPDDFEHTLTLTYQNKGEIAIQNLQIELCWYSQQDQLIYHTSVPLVKEQNPAFKPGQTRVTRVTYRIPFKKADYGDYKIRIIHAN